MEYTQTERHKELMNNARELRKNMTKQERKLWYNFLRGYWIRCAGKSNRRIYR